MNSPKELIKTWVQDVVIDLNLCPFAKRPFNRGAVEIIDSLNETTKFMANDFLTELEKLNSDPKISNTLLSFSNCKFDFYQFNDFIGSCEDLLDELILREEYQIVCFHPAFHFDKVRPNKRINFVNRSPLPLIHILRVSEIQQMVMGTQESDLICYNNRVTLEEMEESKFNKTFNYLQT